jgi:hypothetical protein
MITLNALKYQEIRDRENQPNKQTNSHQTNKNPAVFQQIKQDSGTYI